MYIKEKLGGCAPNVVAAEYYSLEISQAPALRKIRNIRNMCGCVLCGFVLIFILIWEYFFKKKASKDIFHINVVRCLRCNAVELNECALGQSCLSTSLLNNHLCIAHSLTRGRMRDVYLPGVWFHTHAGQISVNIWNSDLVST